MGHKPTQAVLDELEITALLDALGPVMPILERLVEIWRQRETDPIAHQRPAVHSISPEQETLGDFSEPNYARVPSIYQGRGRRENLTGLYETTLHEVEDRRRCDIFAGYQACREIFTPSQWEVIYLYWNQGLTQETIAKTLDVKRSAVSGRLTRATAKKEQHDKRMRQERLDHLRTMQKESYE